jgi:hypothetical protein
MLEVMLMNTARSIPVIIFVMLGFFTSVEARWATPDDLDILTESYNRNLQINQDGTTVETIDLTLVATKESGKDRLVSFPLVYNAQSSKLVVLEAKTISNGIEYPVDLKEIEDKPLASSPQGFDQHRQLLIAFPEIALNAKIFIKYQTTVTEVPVPGFFSTEFIYGADSYWKNSSVKITSVLPFFVEVNDPEKVLTVTQKQSKKQYEMDITLTKPIIKVAIDEQNMSLDRKLMPWVTISTLNQWSKLGALLVPQYEEKINQKLPSLFETIANEAEKRPTTVEKINTVTSKLSEAITYMGDWRTIKGAYIPRPLAEIVKSKIGDCKDFSAATVAILRRMGISSNVALVYRGWEPNQSPNHLPNLHQFNHAFVMVEDKDKTLWIDPTNFSSYAQGVYPDVANRGALVLKPLGPTLLHTQALELKDSSMTLLEKISMPQEEFDIAKVEGELSLSGTAVLPLTGADLRFSKEIISRAIINTVANESRVVNWHVGDYNLGSRIVDNVKFNFNLTEKHTRLKTTAGNAFLLPTSNQITILLTKTEDRVTDLLFYNPATYHRRVLLPQTSLIGTEAVCRVDSPWFTGIRNVANTPTGIEVTDELVVKKNKILNAELKSDEYAKFQGEVFNCFGDTALVYKHTEP